MEKKKQYEAFYAGYTYTTPLTYWTATEEVKKRMARVEVSGSKKIPAGGLPIISDGKTAYIDASDGHTAILAASGMKKSLCGFMPLIATAGLAEENMVITDPKGGATRS
ncbi:MAG: hypothetical protein LUH51_00380 [Firmicutes bacterium]|nr:hypothetical protein [Bacillota bacterium]